ncbi:MAG: response regulator [Anaerolineae bacterium]|nr:response regulator [Anaerolineae bacterium]
MRDLLEISSIQPMFALPMHMLNETQIARRPHILIVDDDADVLGLLKLMVQAQNDVTCVRSGAEALEQIAAHSFDLVLLDIMMPEVSGMDVLKSIRTNIQTADLPVILVTALAKSDEIVAGLQAGANDYITKPFDLDVARARIASQIALKRRLDERQQAISRLTSGYEMQDRFLKIASHDLKNPLNNIRLAHFYLRSILDDHPDVNAALDTIENTLNNMDELVAEYLESSALQTGQEELRLEAISAEDAVWEVISRYSAAAARKNVTLLIGATDGIVLADSQRLHQILSNLVSNAIKYSPHGKCVTVSSVVGGGQVQMSVADEGPGIPAAEQSALFLPFSKLSNKPTGGESSSGLGLWIARELARIQNGSVGFECPASGGSIFWVKMPAHPDSLPPLP